ncbi:hypothetical protein N9O08_03185 [Alphaproteobacteria bacterium]|nr:hypothetical protein [Alphaproteobacteria bacterium]
MKALNKYLILSFFIFSIPSIGFALPKCGNTLHNCTGEYTWKSGNKYVGDWKNGNRNGKGVFTWKTGDEYEGEYKDGKRHGQGILTYSNGDKYEGDWVNGHWTGEGIVTFANGTKKEGVFKDSKFLYAKKLKTNTIEKRLKAKAKELVNKANKVKSKNNSKTTGYSKWKWGESPSVGFSNLHPAIKFIIKNEIGGSLLAIEEATKCSFKARYKFAGEIYKLKTDFNKINWKTQSRFYSDDTIKFKYTCEENCFYGLYKFNNYKWSAKKQIFFEFRNKNNMYRRAKDAMSDLSKVCNKSSSKY